MEHEPIPVWRSPEGHQYCCRHSEHGAWVLWPCEEAE